MFQIQTSTSIYQSFDRSLNESSSMSTLVTVPSTFELISEEIFNYFETHRKQIPLLVFAYLSTILWIIYCILYNSRVQGRLLSYLLRRFYFKESSQIRFDSISISFISGSILFRNLHYATGSYFVFVRDGYVVFRYWCSEKSKPVKRIKIHLNHLDVQIFHPIRSNTIPTDNNTNSEDYQSISSSDEKPLMEKLRSLFPAVEIIVENVG